MATPAAARRAAQRVAWTVVLLWAVVLLTVAQAAVQVVEQAVERAIATGAAVLWRETTAGSTFGGREVAASRPTGHPRAHDSGIEAGRLK